MTGIATTVLGWILPIVLAPALYFAARELLNFNLAIDNWPPIVKRFTVVALGTLIVAVLNALGVIAPPECAALPNEVTTECAKALGAPTIVKGLAAAIGAFAVHAIKKSPPQA